METISAYIVWTTILMLFAALIWRRYSRRAAGIFLLYSLLVVVALAQIDSDGKGGILIVNLIIALGLTVLTLSRRYHRGTRTACVTLMLVIPLYLTLGWMAGYRTVTFPPAEKMEQKVVYREAWLDGMFAMHQCTFEHYVPKVIPYLIALAVLAFLPFREKEQSQQGGGEVRS